MILVYYYHFEACHNKNYKNKFDCVFRITVEDAILTCEEYRTQDAPNLTCMLLSDNKTHEIFRKLNRYFVHNTVALPVTVFGGPFSLWKDVFRFYNNLIGKRTHTKLEKVSELTFKEANSLLAQHYLSLLPHNKT